MTTHKKRPRKDAGIRASHAAISSVGVLRIVTAG